MGTGEPNEGDHEQRIADLTRRVGELEHRVVELETRAAQDLASRASAESRAAHPSAQQPLQAARPLAQQPAQPVEPAAPASPNWPWGREWPGQPPQQRPAQPAMPASQAATAQPATPPTAQPVGQPATPHLQPPPAAPAGGFPGWTGSARDHQYARAQQQQSPTSTARPPQQPPAAWAPQKPPAAWAPQKPAAPRTPGPSLTSELGISLGSLRDLESRLTGRLLAWVGGAAVVLGAIFFLSMAFSRGWIGPEGRVGLGLALGEALIGAGAILFGRRQEQLAHVLVASGLGVVSLALFAGTRLYGLYSPEVALAGSFVTAIVAAGIAIRFNSESVAVYGLLAVAAAPPVLGAGATVVTMLFLGTAIVGTTAIALARAWRWLPPIAFAITAPQFLFWLSTGPDAATAVAALGAYWLLHALAAAADELRASRPEAETRAQSLFVANSTLALGGGLFVLSGGSAVWQGAFVGALAAAHLAFGGYTVWRRGDTNQFGLLVNGIGVGLVAFAIERQFDGPPVAIGWAIEAVVLGAVYGLRRNVYAGGAAILVAGLAAAHLAWYEYPGLQWSLAGGSGHGAFAFADPAGLTLVCLALACILGGWLSHNRAVLIAMTTVCMLTIAYALPYELSGPPLVAGWAAEAVALVALFGPRKNSYITAAEVLLAALAVTHLGAFDYPGVGWSFEGGSGPGAFAFADSAGLTLACLLVACVAGGWLSRSRDVRIGLMLAGLLGIAYSLPFELSGAALVSGWAAEAVVLAALVAQFELRKNPYVVSAALFFAGLAFLHFGCYEYPGVDWSLEGGAGSGSFAFADTGGLTLACLLVACVLGGLLSRSRDIRNALTVVGLLAIAYSLPYELSGAALVAGWAAEAVLLMAVFGLRGYPTGSAAAGLFGGLGVAHLCSFEFPAQLWSLAGGHGAGSAPFVDTAGLTLGCLLVAAALAGWLSRSHSTRCGLTTAGLLAVAYALPYELSGSALVAGWAALVPVAVTAEALLDRLPGVPPARLKLRAVPVLGMNEVHWPDSPLLVALAGVFASIAHLLVYDLPVSASEAIVPPAVPFSDLATLSAAFGVAGFIAAALITARPDLRAGLILLAAGLAAYTCVFELALPFAVVAWCAVAVALAVLSLFDRFGRWAYAAGAATIVAIAATAALVVLVPLDRLGVQPAVPLTGTWFAIDSVLAIGAVSVALVAGTILLPLDRSIRTTLRLMAATGAVYLASVLVVDFFQVRVGGTTALEELQKQAQVGVSILWGVIGMAVFVVGIVRWRQVVRESGLALLSLATVKVFLFDLSYLDVSYRVLSLMGLGLVLLAGAYAYQSLRPRRPDEDGAAAGTEAEAGVGPEPGLATESGPEAPAE
jgi:hypothetical protein